MKHFFDVPPRFHIRFHFSLSQLLAVATVFSVGFGLVIVFHQQVSGPQRLISASYSGDLNGVRYWLEQNVSVNVQDGWDTSPLMVAAGWGHLEIVKVLLQYGALLDERSRFDRTPLMWAAASGQKQTVQFLLEAGADPDLVDARGMTVIDLALKEGHSDIAETIRSFVRVE